MMWPAWRIGLSMVIFQAAWFACVIGAAHDRPYLGASACVTAVLIHIASVKEKALEACVVLAALIIGVLWDSVMASLWIIHYASPDPIAGLAPIWILALWALFATTLREPLRWLHGRPILAAVFGALGGPLSYGAAAKLGACTFADPSQALTVLAIGWGVMVPLLIECARRIGRAHVEATV